MHPLVITLPQCEYGIGDVIATVDAAKLIAGVKCAPVAV